MKQLLANSKNLVIFAYRVVFVLPKMADKLIPTCKNNLADVLVVNY